MSNDDGPQQFAQQRWQRAAGSTEIVLLRHGASMPYVPGNAFPLVDGQGDPPLSELGVAQAALSAERLASEPFNALYATSMQRTQQTVAPLAEALDMGVEIEPDLREVHLGDWEGGLLRQRAAENHPIYEQMHREERWDAIPGAETNKNFADRCMRALDRIADIHPDQLVLCVVHGGVIGSVLAHITNSRAFAFGGSDNCSISQIVKDKETWAMRRFNDSGHLFNELHHGV